MVEADIGVLPALDQDKLFGIVTDRHLAVRGVAEGWHGGSPVLQVMTADVRTCYSDEEVDRELETMADQEVRRMPVCAEDGLVVGPLSIGDAARFGPDKEEVAETLAEICEPRGPYCQSVAA